MEGSEATQEHEHEQAEHVGVSGEDIAQANAEQTPVSDLDMQNPDRPGPASAPDPSAQSGDPLDQATQAALGVEGAGPVPNAGEATSVGDGE